MDQFMKMIMEAAMEQQKQMNKTGQRPNFSNDDIIVKSAKESARVNKVLFDEHVKVGFTQEQALEIVTSLISRK